MDHLGDVYVFNISFLCKKCIIIFSKIVYSNNRIKFYVALMMKLMKFAIYNFHRFSIVILKGMSFSTRKLIKKYINIHIDTVELFRIARSRFPDTKSTWKGSWVLSPSFRQMHSDMHFWRRKPYAFEESL